VDSLKARHTKMTNGDDYTFPGTIDEHIADAPVLTIGGLTKREYFAAMALSVLVYHERPIDFKGCSEIAVTFADELIEALNREAK
jgi:hypothetical protein